MGLPKAPSSPLTETTDREELDTTKDIFAVVEAILELSKQASKFSKKN